MSENQLTLLCAAKLHKNQLERHLELFEHIPEVGRVLVVRREPLDTRLSKLHNVNFPPGGLVSEMWGMARTVARVSATERVDWVLGFNPVPWGGLAFAGARRGRVRTCLSLIGMDFLQIQRVSGWPFLEAVRRAEAVTVTGASMQRRLAELGVQEERIRILPHSVDLGRFSPAPEEKSWDVVAVGQLIQRKRMEVLIEAVARLKREGRPARLAILGRGPKEAELREQCVRTNVADCVEFLGYRDDVEAVLKRARAFALVSEWEGVPFALMEALATGLVPIVTRVGTIEDWVEHGVTGLLTDVGRADQVADAISLALSERGEQMRTNILAQRARLSLEQGAQVWREILGLGPS